jgi:peptidoglycan hydrolase CwlO-like protein
MATEEPEQKRRNWWIWISAALAVVAVGLLAWALTLRSDRDSAQEDLRTAQQELASTQEQLEAAQQDVAEQPPEDDGVGGAVLAAGGLAAAKSLYDDLAEQLGAAEEDLASTQQDLEEAQRQAEQAEQDAAAAEERAAGAGDETAKAQAEADQARAEADAANAQLAIATDCAKAYVTAFGALFEGDDPEAQAEAVREQFESISTDCKAALAGG